MVVSNIWYFQPYLGKWSNFTNILQMGWNHQLVFTCLYAKAKKNIKVVHAVATVSMANHLASWFIRFASVPRRRWGLKSRYGQKLFSIQVDVVLHLLRGWLEHSVGMKSSYSPAQEKHNCEWLDWFEVLFFWKLPTIDECEIPIWSWYKYEYKFKYTYKFKIIWI